MRVGKRSSMVGGIAILAGLSLSCIGCQTQAAILRIRATAPVADNDSTCAAPVSVPATNPVTIHFRWSGPTSGEDSLVVARGAVASLSRWARPGSYTVLGWASDAGGPGCSDTTFVTIKAAPGKPTFLP